MEKIQRGILEDIPLQARYMTLVLESAEDVAEVMTELKTLVDGLHTVLGVGASLVQLLGKTIPGLKSFPGKSVNGLDIPATPASLWLWLRGEDRGELLLRSRMIAQTLSPAFRMEEVLDAFRYGNGRDLTGYEDGTENPVGEEAIRTAIVQDASPGMMGSSFVVVQQWLHELDTFELLSQQQQDHIIGRRKSDNQELEDAPVSAHVRRTAQESFDPEAFILRRSMPWVEGGEAGLNFVAFGHSFAAFENQFDRMSGMDDGIIDALFSFSRPVGGAYFWCPPMNKQQVDLSLLGF